MPTRTRIVMESGTGEVRVGRHVKQFFLSGRHLSTEALIKEFERWAGAGNNARLWIYREPRRVKSKRSKYKKICAFYGTGRVRPTQKERERIDRLVEATGAVRPRRTLFYSRPEPPLQTRAVRRSIIPGATEAPQPTQAAPVIMPTSTAATTATWAWNTADTDNDLFRRGESEPEQF